MPQEFYLLRGVFLRGAKNEGAFSLSNTQLTKVGNGKPENTDLRHHCRCNGYIRGRFLPLGYD